MKKNRRAEPSAGPQPPSILTQTFVVLGSRFTLRFPSQDVASAFHHVLGGFPTTDPSSTDLLFTISNITNGFAARRNRSPFGVYQNLEDLVSRLESALLHDALNQASYPCIHAGAVTHSGQTLILPGASGSGKTTLVLGLVLRGWTLLSDEIVPVFPSTMEVGVFPRVLCIKNNSLPLFQHMDTENHLASTNVLQILGVACIAARCFTHPPPGTRFTPGPIVFPTYRPGAPTRLHEISGTDALTRLIGLTTNRQRIDHLPATLGKLVESTTCFALTAGSLEPALDVLESIFQRTVPDANRHARTGSASNTPPG